MKEYKYNEKFFGEWLSQHPELSKRDILNVLGTKYYGSLDSWAGGNPMPVASMLKLCNAYQIQIENFFIGMMPIVNDTHTEDTDINDVHKTEVPSIADANFNSGKRAQLEAHHTKELYLASKKAQQREDDIRKEYEQRMDEQRRQYLDIITKQTEQISYLSNIIATSHGSTVGFLNEPLLSSSGKIHGAYNKK